MHETHCVGLEGTLFGQQRAMPSSTGLLLSTASKNGLHRSSPPPRSLASPSSALKSDVHRDGRRDSETRARHEPSLHHFTTSSRDQSVDVMIVQRCFVYNGFVQLYLSVVIAQFLDFVCIFIFLSYLLCNFRILCNIS